MWPLCDLYVTFIHKNHSSFFSPAHSTPTYSSAEASWTTSTLGGTCWASIRCTPAWFVNQRPIVEFFSLFTFFWFCVLQRFLGLVRTPWIGRRCTTPNSSGFCNWTVARNPLAESSTERASIQSRIRTWPWTKMKNSAMNKHKNLSLCIVVRLSASHDIPEPATVGWRICIPAWNCWTSDCKFV